jgi:hypothetical protein
MMNRLARFSAAALGVALIGPTPLAAQQQASDWEAFLGCWRPVAQDGNVNFRGGVLRCVVPSNDAAVAYVVTVDSGRIMARDTIDAGNREQKIDAEGCTGTESARWSDDRRRVFLHSKLTCLKGNERIANSIVAITPSGDWLDVQTVNVAGNTMASAVHYRESIVNRNELPAELAPALDAIAARKMAINTARTAAGSSLSVQNIVEAVKSVDSTAVQAWIVERGTRFSLDAKQLVTLADAGVPGSVTDVMIGASYPDRFALNHGAPGGGGMSGAQVFSQSDSARIVAGYLRDRCGAVLPSLALAPSAYDACRFSYGYRGYARYMYYDYLYPYAYSPYSLYGSGYAGYYNPYYYGSVYYGGPVVIEKGTGTGETHGRVVKGQGYTRGSDDVTRGSGASATTAGSSGSSSSGSSSAGAASSGSSSSGGGRTAVSRPPA